MGTHTTHLLAQRDELGDGHLITADSPGRGPFAVILDGAGDYGRQVADGSKSDDWVVVGDNDGATVLEIEGCLQRRNVCGCLVWGCEIVKEKTGLEKRVLKDLWEASVVRGTFGSLRLEMSGKGCDGPSCDG